MKLTSTIGFSAYQAARFSVNVHTSFSKMTLGPHLHANQAYRQGRDFIARMQDQGTPVLGAYVFDEVTGEQILDITPHRSRLRRFIALLIGF